MKRTAMQTVVNKICVETDFYYEWLNHGEKEWVSDFTDLMTFLKEAKDKGFNVDNGIYSYEDKVKLLKEE